MMLKKRRTGLEKFRHKKTTWELASISPLTFHTCTRQHRVTPVNEAPVAMRLTRHSKAWTVGKLCVYTLIKTVYLSFVNHVLVFVFRAPLQRVGSLAE